MPHDTRESGIGIEACVDSVESALAAEAGGASRVELCGNLLEGGTTPSAAMIELCAERLKIPVFVIIRPRAGDFHYSDEEFKVMLRDIRHAAAFGAAGVVIGALSRDGTVDGEGTRKLMMAARPLPVTFHRAFDACRERGQALEALISLGVDRVLTSGGAATAESGVDVLRELVARASGRIGILAGGGVNESNVARIVDGSGVSEVHVRLTRQVVSPMEFTNPAVDFGGRTALSDRVRTVTDESRIAELRRLIGAAARGRGTNRGEGTP